MLPRFRHCARLPETRGFVDKQAAVLWSRGDAPGAVPQGPSPAARNRSTVVSPACVAVEGAEAVVVDSCVFRRVAAAYALAVSGGSRRCAVANCTFSDLSGGGIFAGSVDAARARDRRRVDAQLSVFGNTVVDSGREFRGAAAIFGGYLAQSRVERNTVRRAPYSGISLGWGWGRLRGSLARDNVVAENFVKDAVQTLADGGGIYLLGSQPRTRVSRNFVDGFRHGYAYYLDDGSVHVMVADNVARYRRPPDDASRSTGKGPACATAKGYAHALAGFKCCGWSDRGPGVPLFTLGCVDAAQWKLRGWSERAFPERHALIVARSGDARASCLHHAWDADALAVVRGAGDPRTAANKRAVLATGATEAPGGDCDELRTIVSKHHASWCPCQAAVTVHYDDENDASCDRPWRQTRREASHVAAKCKLPESMKYDATRLRGVQERANAAPRWAGGRSA